MYQNRKVVGICSAELDQQFHLKILERVIKELIDFGYYVMLFGSDSDMYHLTESDIADASVFDLMNYDRMDVVLIFSETIKQQSIINHIVKKVTDAAVPVISVGKELDLCYNVIYDTETAFEKLVRHVIEYHGVREVNFISGMKGNEIAERRLQIYREVLEDNDILYEEDRVGYGDFWFGPTREVMDRFMAPSKVPPEAIICANDSMAVAVCDYLREHQMSVPEDMIVAGIDGIDEGIRHTPGITTCVRDEYHDAKTIAGLVKSLCQGERIAGTTVLMYHLQLSQSCGCQKRRLFDADSVIAGLSLESANYRADIRKFSEMSDEFLRCETDQEFWDVAAKYMPDNSFLCINSDLSLSGVSESEKRVDGFTPKLQTLVRLQGETMRSECYLENVVPEVGKDYMRDRPVLLFPLHFCEKVVGYIGIWIGAGRQANLNRWIHFLLSLDHSAGKRLIEHSSVSGRE
ncbi:MAG: substrate-binding domain-containing protein [Eubacteriales bacterium]|nr:substrate-binding domain-containing protein [Eubacteriales bacterium]